MARKIIGLLVLGFLIASWVVGHRLNAARGEPLASLRSVPIASGPIVLENLEVLVPARMVHLTPTIADELDGATDSAIFAGDLAASPLVLVGRELPPGEHVWHARVSFVRLAVDIEPAAVTETWCREQSMDAAHPLTRAEVRAEAIGPVCRTEHTNPSEPHALLVYAAFVQPGTDWLMVCHTDDRSPEDLAACDEVARTVRPHG